MDASNIRTTQELANFVAAWLIDNAMDTMQDMAIDTFGGPYPIPVDVDRVKDMAQSYYDELFVNGGALDNEGTVKDIIEEMLTNKRVRIETVKLCLVYCPVLEGGKK